MSEKKDFVQRGSKISLREVSPENFWPVINLDVADDQHKFVASNAASIAQAYFYRDNAWFRAIYADETPVGFLMLEDKPEEASYFLWRLMVDEKYQGMGFGKRGVGLLIDHVRTRPDATRLKVSCVLGERGPFEFYKSMGFKPTGEILEGETVLEFIL